MEWLSDLFTAIIEGIASVITWVLVKLLQALAAVLSLIPVPDFLQSASPAIQTMFDVFGWGLGIAQADFGFSAVMTALVIRFSIRRLPFIGG